MRILGIIVLTASFMAASLGCSSMHTRNSGGAVPEKKCFSDCEKVTGLNLLKMPGSLASSLLNIAGTMTDAVITNVISPSKASLEKTKKDFTDLGKKLENNTLDIVDCEQAAHGDAMNTLAGSITK